MAKNRHFFNVFALFVLLAITAIVVPTSAFADGEYTPVYNPTLDISKMSGKIDVDGNLGDSGWRTAGKVGNFAEHRPGDQTRPPVETEAFITYDDKNLYVAFVCYDDPATVRASFTEYDGYIGADDNICFLLDTYADAAWAYEFNVNPYGIQGDQLWSEQGGEDGGYDLIWEAAGKVTDSGYQIEMAVPFSSLRFPNRAEQVWKVDFWRNHPREIRRQYSWAAYDRNEACWPCQWGTVTGIKNVQPGKGIEIIPAAVGYQSGVRNVGSDGIPRDFVNDDGDGEISLNAKYAVTSDITTEVTFNPDFSQVEADAAQIDVNSTTALFFSERRPFFQEGSDLFRTSFDVFYSRTINDPQFAAKATARLGRTSIAYMSAYDEHTAYIVPFEEGSGLYSGGKSLSNILRARRTFGEDSQIGMIVTDRRLDGGGSGSVYSADGRFRLAKAYKFLFQVAGTYTDEPEEAAEPDDSAETFWEDYTPEFDGQSFWGHALYAAIVRDGRNDYASFAYTERSPTFRTDNGYEPVNNQRKWSFNGYYVFRFDSGLLEQINPSVNVAQIYNFDHVKKDEWVSLDLELQFRVAQLSTHSQYLRSNELFSGIQFDNIWNLHTCVHSRPSDLLACGGSVNYGHRIARRAKVMGKETTASLWADIKPADRLLIETSCSYTKSVAIDSNSATGVKSDDKIYEGHLLWSRTSLQVLRELSFRLVVQYDDFRERWDVDPLVTYRLNPFSIFYVGTTHDYQKYYGLGDDGVESTTKLAARQFFCKLQYLLQI